MRARQVLGVESKGVSKMKILFLLLALTPACAFADLVGTPTPRTIEVHATQLGQSNYPKIVEGTGYFQKFLARTAMLGGRYTTSQHEGQTWIKYHKQANEDLIPMILNLTQGCKKFDSQCLSLIRFYNGSSKNIFDPEFSGEVMLPEREVIFTAVIDYGDGFRLEKQGDLWIYHVRKDLQESLRMLSGFASWTPAISYIEDGGVRRFFKVKIDE